MFQTGSWSLVKKLMTFYFLSTVGILSAISLFLYPSFVKGLYHPAETTNEISTTTLKQSKDDICPVCFRKCIIAFLASIVSSLALGYIVARKGLKRIDEFTQLMTKISALALDDRVELRDWPRELKYLGDTFNRMLDRLQASFVRLNQFSSDIAHELRTPINNLQGLTEVALTQKNPVEYRQLLESHLEEFHFLSRLIENLLFIARSSNGQTIINQERLKVKDEISKIFDFYSALAEEKNIELVCTGDEVVLCIDKILFKRLINNILSNAIRHTPKQGKISCQIFHKTHATTLVIQDTGTGIKAECLDKIFDRFYRVDFARNNGVGELGLGLSIAKSIMDLHHGSIAITSKEQQGTCVTLTFPPHPY